MDTDTLDNLARAGDEITTTIFIARKIHDLPAKIIEVYGTLVLVEYQRRDGSTGLYEAYRGNPYAIIRRIPYTRLPKYWENAMYTHRIPWIGRPKGERGKRYLAAWETDINRNI